MRIATLITLIVTLFGLPLGSGCTDDEPRSDTSDAPDGVDAADTVDGPDVVDGVDVADAVDTADTQADDSADTSPDDVPDEGDSAPDTTATDADTIAGDTLEDTTLVDGADALDTASTDTSPTLPLPGFGTISGECGVIDTELADPAPSFFVNAIDFGADPYDEVDFARLLPDSQEMIRDGNAGGSSVMSEVFALEVLERCELASLIATETEIVYDQQGKITDILVEIDGDKVGVSVTRAVGFPFDAPYTVAQAKSILEKKLGDILISSANVSAPYRWVKQILHVLAYDAPHVDSLRTAWAQIAEATRADTIVIVTVTNGSDAFIY